jgi:hypothetical protein
MSGLFVNCLFGTVRISGHDLKSGLSKRAIESPTEKIGWEQNSSNLEKDRY